jgi:hypothetical protein
MTRAGALAMVLCWAAWVRADPAQPAVVTIKAKEAPARQVFEDLARQAGAVIPAMPTDLLEGPALPKVTIDVERQGFWTALKELGRVSGVGPVVNEDDPYPRLVLGAGSGFWEEPHAIAGPVVVFASDISRSATVELGKTRHRTQRELNLEMTAFVEPGLRVVWVSPELEVKEAVDENGKALTAAKPEASASDEPVEEDAEFADQPGTRVWSWDLLLRLDCPENVGKKLAKLRGVTRIRVATKVSPVEVVDVMKARDVTRTVGGVGFTFRNLKKADIEYVLRISLRRQKTPAKEWGLLMHSVYNGMMSLYDEKGRLVASRCTENGGEYGGQKVDATLRFVREPGVSHGEAGEPHKLVWEAAVEGKDVAIEFELRDLPVPE